MATIQALTNKAYLRVVDLRAQLAGAEAAHQVLVRELAAAADPAAEGEAERHRRRAEEAEAALAEQQTRAEGAFARTGAVVADQEADLLLQQQRISTLEAQLRQLQGEHLDLQAALQRAADAEAGRLDAEVRLRAAQEEAGRLGRALEEEQKLRQGFEAAEVAALSEAQRLRAQVATQGPKEPTPAGLVLGPWPAAGLQALERDIAQSAERRMDEEPRIVRDEEGPEPPTPPPPPRATGSGRRRAIAARAA